MSKGYNYSGDEIELIGRAKLRPVNPYRVKKVKSYLTPRTAEEMERDEENIIVKSSAPGRYSGYLEDRDYNEEEIWVDEEW